MRSLASVESELYAIDSVVAPRLPILSFVMAAGIPNHATLEIHSNDQSNDYSDLDWVITGFPANVKLILSTLESYGNIIESLKKRIPEKSLNYLHIVPMTQSNVKIILESWLNESKRSLVDSQWDILDNLLLIFLINIIDVIDIIDDYY